MKEDSEDLVQNIFLNFWKHRESIAEDYPTRAQYLYVVSKNIIFSHVERKKNRAIIFQRFEHKVCWQHRAPDLQAELDRSAVTRCLDKAIALLPQKGRAVLLARLRFGLKKEAIGKLHGVSIHTVRNHFVVSRSHIRKALAGVDPELADRL